MRKTEATASTRQEAIQNALNKLGAELHEVDIEILDEGSKGFLGLGSRDVHVRVTAEHLPDDGSRDEFEDDNIGNRSDMPEPRQRDVRVDNRSGSGSTPRSGRRPQRGGSNRGRDGNREGNQSRSGQGNRRDGGPRQERGNRGDRSARQEQGNRPERGSGQDRGDRQDKGSRREGGDRQDRSRRSEGGSRQDKGSRPEGGNRQDRSQRSNRGPRQQQRPEKREYHQARPKRKERETPVDLEAAGALGATAAALLQEIITKMGMECTVVNSINEDQDILLEVSTEDSAILIGRKGRTLESLQFMINRIILNADNAEIVDRIVVDVEGYLKRRRESLEEMALSMAEKAKSTGRSIRVKPLDPRERRIIHLVLESIEGVRTYSLGNSELRRIVIVPENERGSEEDSENGQTAQADGEGGTDNSDSVEVADTEEKSDSVDATAESATDDSGDSNDSASPEPEESGDVASESTMEDSDDSDDSASPEPDEAVEADKES